MPLYKGGGLPKIFCPKVAFGDYAENPITVIFYLHLGTNAITYRDRGRHQKAE